MSKRFRASAFVRRLQRNAVQYPIRVGGSCCVAACKAWRHYRLHFRLCLARFGAPCFCSIAADRHAAPPPLTAVIQVLPMMLNGLQ